MHSIEEDPQEAFARTDMENVQFRTGDPVIDDWEKKLAENKDADIDWDAGVDKEFLDRFKAFSKRTDEAQSPELAEARLKSESVSLSDKERDEFLASLSDGFGDNYK